MAHFTCSSCSTPHELFGGSDKFVKAASDLRINVLGMSTAVAPSESPSELQNNSEQQSDTDDSLQENCP
jgi:hypothetical protein